MEKRKRGGPRRRSSSKRSKAPPPDVSNRENRHNNNINSCSSNTNGQSKGQHHRPPQQQQQNRHQHQRSILKHKELSLCMNSSSGFRDAQVPLQVILPPSKGDNHQNNKVFTIDQSGNSSIEKQPLSDSDNVHVDNTTGISVEEFECGVSVEGSDKQEWSFTLYDFDGRGKITKDDLASLMKSLYDAVGSSIKLPQNGTKTLKLRLTVSPDATKVTDQETTKQNIVVDAHTTTVPEKSPTRADQCPVVITASTKDSPSKENSHPKQNNMNKRHHSPATSPMSPGKPDDAKANIVPSPGKPRLTSVEQKQLAELVQKNMERHHRQQLQLRRHHSDHPQSSEVRHRRHHTHHHTRSKPSQESQDRRNYYLDLAGVENYNTSSILNTSAPANVLDTTNAKQQTTEIHSRSKNRSRVDTLIDSYHQQHQRSKSHDLANKVTFDDLASPERFAKLLETSNNAPEVSAKLTSTPSKSNKIKHRPISLQVPEEVSPHHHRRHRNRERNRSLAMKQVAEWIDREHSFEHDDEKVMVQRHEHHHIHEHHHHHHYHHYHET